MINHSERMLDRLENTLNDFDASKRREALQEIAELVKSGQVEAAGERDEVNLHFHSFFSYNAYGWSPSRIAWESKKYGLAVAGIVDFDVVDGMDEFLQAGEIIDIPTTVALETRVRVPEYSDKVISSPNEPGIGYYMAAGCFQQPTNKPGLKALENLKETARKRNLQLLDKVNDYLDPVRLDYDRDVMPLTPSGNATERHLLAAYDTKARIVMGDKVGQFWAKALGITAEEAEGLLNDSAALHEKMRSKLMKFGGVGYVAPTEDAFPEIKSVIQMSKDMAGLPTMTWLDGTNPGEADMPALLGLVESMGTVALNIVPDRNWNIKDAEEKRVKVENLDKAVRAARALNLPLCVGTELNKLGLPFVDDFSAPELQPYVDDFMAGAYFFWGHTVLARKAGMGFASDWADAHFSNRAQKNEFYEKVGRLASPLANLNSSLKDATPEQVLKALG
ncbi:MAG: hypothetical protein ACOX3G_08265 [Armatimonadota bacterium]|jgi:hypothetical protein